MKNSEEQYRVYTENSPVAFFVVNPEGRYVQVNDAATKLLLYSKNEFLKMSIVDISFERNISFELKQFAALKETGKARFETALKRKDGEPVYVILNATRLPNGNMMAFCENITDRKKTEITMKESEEKHRAIFEGASDGIVAAGSKTKSFVFANPRMCEITGYSLEELLKLNMSDIHPEKDLPLVIDQFTKLGQGIIALATDIPVLRKDRTVVYCDVSSKPVKIGEHEYLVGFFRDITERKENGGKHGKRATGTQPNYRFFSNNNIL